METIVRTLPGFMELLPEDQIKFNNIVDIIRSTYEKYGFLPLDTPIIEDTSVLLKKAGGETQAQMYSFKKGDNDLSLRFDLTVPLAKYVTLNKNDLAFPFKRYQIGKVYRGEKPQRGRYREFYQCDIDIIGNEKLSISNDSELISIVNEIFEKLDIGKFVIRANNRKILTGLIESLNLENSTFEILHALDKLEKIGIEKTLSIISDYANSDQLKTIEEFINISGDNDQILEKLKIFAQSLKNENFDLGLKELEQLYNDSKAYGIDNLILDLSIIRGLDYYTGNVFETNLVDHKEIGSICSGGRYENLVNSFSNNKMPGVGISIGLTRLFFLLNELNLIDKKYNSLIDYYIISMSENEKTYCIDVANKLRKKGYKVQLNLEDSKPAKKFKVADKLNVENVIVIGQEEKDQNMVTLKNMKDGNQVMIDVEKI